MDKNNGAVTSLTTDLDRKLDIAEERVEIANGSLRVTGKGNSDITIPLSEIKKASVESGLGIIRLVIRKKSGEEVEVAYSSKENYANFNKLANAINDHFTKGQDVKVNFEEKRLRKESRIHTVMWLYGFAQNYKGLMVLGVIISLVAALVGLVPPYLLKILIDNVILMPGQSGNLFAELTLALIVSYAVGTLLNITQTYLLSKAGNKIISEMRSKLYEHVLRLPPSFIDKMSTGRILSRLISDAGETQWLMTYGLPTVVTNALTIIGVGIILFSLYPPLAVYVLIPIPLVVLVVFRYRSRSENIYHRNWRKSADMTSVINNVVPNYAIVKAAAKESFESKKFNVIISDYFRSQMDLTRLNMYYWPFIGFLTALATVMIWWVGGNAVIAGTIPLGIITAFLAYMTMFYGPINQLGNIIPFVQQSITSGDRLRELFGEKTVMSNARGAKKMKLDGDVVFEGVSFEYDHPFQTIKNVSFTIEAGKKTAIVGKSGSGKTTIIKLILRLYDVNGGRIRIGKTDIRNLDLDHLRESVAYVPQDAVLFDNSVAYNVGYYSHVMRNPIDIIRACDQAVMHEEVMRMPLRYDTNIGERGIAMSGGQRQRLSIARAMLTNPDIILFDEVTSNLDAINAEEVGKTIAEFARNHTVVYITHLVNEIVSADRAIVIDEGNLVEQGKPSDLLDKKGKLYDMVKGKLGKSQKSTKPESKRGMVIGLAVSPNRLKISAGGRKSMVNLTVNGKKFVDISPTLPFPISSPEFVIFYDNKNNAVSLLEDYTKLAQEQSRMLHEAINVTNFIPKVTAIKKLLVTGDGLEWWVKTNRGNKRILTETRRSVVQLGDRVILLDRHGSVFDIEIDSLDQKSRQIIESSI